MRSDDDLLDFVSNYRDRRPRRKRFLIWVALLVHLVVLAALIGLPLLEVDRELPQIESMATFLVQPSPPPPAPPPPPPPPSPARRERASSASRPLLREASFIAPVSVPSTIPSEDFGGGDLGIPGGVEGGVPGGIGGIGGLPESPAPPPRQEPPRVDFRMEEGRPIKRVDPVYPELAAKAHVQGVVILDVLVDTHGVPDQFKVLRTVPMLEAAATAAVREWRWRPFLIGEKPVPFWVTVTVTFRLA